jgi:hypothetical protein
MGEGPIDLPDPLEQPHLDEESADELLSQLAGEEIDRLLRENDMERVPAELVHPPEPGAAAKAPPKAQRPPAERTPGPAKTDASPLTIADVDEQAAKAAEAVIAQHGVAPGEMTQAAVEATAAANTAQAVDDELAKQLDNIFAQIKNPESALPPVPANQAASLIQRVQATAQQPEKPADLIDQIGALEKQILNTEILQTTQQLLAEPILKAPQPAEDAGPPRLPLYLRPLEWINLPVSRCTEEARDAVGKVAIITLVNALAILLYVLIFR